MTMLELKAAFNTSVIVSTPLHLPYISAKFIEIDPEVWSTLSESTECLTPPVAKQFGATTLNGIA